MSELNTIDHSQYVTVQGQYAVTNEGTGYAIINIHTKQILARNISSFLDCVKTLEYIVGKSEASNHTQNQSNQYAYHPASHQQKVPSFGVKPDVQRLIELYAPTTVRVQKKVDWNKSRYKCYDASGNCIGRVKGKEGDRYWEGTTGGRRY